MNDKTTTKVDLDEVNRFQELCKKADLRSDTFKESCEREKLWERLFDAGATEDELLHPDSRLFERFAHAGPKITLKMMYRHQRLTRRLHIDGYNFNNQAELEKLRAPMREKDAPEGEIVSADHRLFIRFGFVYDSETGGWKDPGPCEGIRAAMDEIGEFIEAFEGVHGEKPTSDDIVEWMGIRRDQLDTAAAQDVEA